MTKILFRLLGRWRLHWRAVVLAFFFAITALIADILKPVAIKFAIDSGVGEASTRNLLIAGGVLTALYAGRGVLAYGQNYMSEFLSQHVAYDLRNDLYNRIQGLSFSFHDRSQTGQLMSRVTVDVETSRQFLSQGLLNLVVTFGRFFFIAIAAFSLNWQLAVCVIASLPVIAFLSANTGQKLRPIWLQVQQAQGAYSAVLNETISGMRVVQAFTAEDREFRSFQQANWEVREKSLDGNRIAALRQPMISFCLNLLQVVVVGYGGYLLMHDKISAGTLSAFVLYTNQLTQPIRQVGALLNTSSRAVAAGDRIFEILDTQSEVTDRPGATQLTEVKGHVVYDHVSFGYGKDFQVISDISIDALPGQTIALLGPVGSGKSTVLNLLPRFYDVTAGSISIDGADIRDLTLESLRGSVGIVMQDVFLFNGTIRENISYGRPECTEEEMIEAAKIARLHDFIMTQPDGYDTWVGERGVTLSGGQRQRVSIARTLLLDPEIPVLDDSTSSVDMETEYLIQQALSALLKGRTAFVIAQRLRTVRNADQIIVLQDGHIAEQGKHDDLLELNGLYREIYDVQLRDQEAVAAAGRTPQETERQA